MFPQTGQDGSDLLDLLQVLKPQRQLRRPQVEGSPSWEVVGRGQQVQAQVGQVTWGRLQVVGQVTPWKQVVGQVTLGKQVGGQVGFLQQVGAFTELK